MKLFFIIFILVSSLNAQAQIDTNLSVLNAIRNQDTSAKFSSNQLALENFLVKNLKYPDLARESNTQGQVLVEFVVCEDGTICYAKVINGSDKVLGKEALRVVNLMPKWKPGLKNGKEISSYFTLPISFVLEDSSPIIIKK